jgi:hypothetical protein
MNEKKLTVGKLYRIDTVIFNCQVNMYKGPSFNNHYGYLENEYLTLLVLDKIFGDNFQWKKILAGNKIGWILLDTCYFKEVQL